MTIERIRSFYNRRPIQPFTIHTTSGESFTVTHPETMAFDEESEILLILQGPGRMAMLDLSNIAEIT